MSHEQTDPALLTPQELCGRGPIVHRAPLIVRLYQIDARYRLKPRGAFELFSPIVVDAWRQNAAIEVLWERGIWPVLSYYDVELFGGAIAPGFSNEATVGICLGRLSDHTLVLATELQGQAYRSSGVRETMRKRLTDTPELALRTRSMAGMIQPFKPDEFVLRHVPEQLAHLDVHPCQPAPSIAQLSALEAEFVPAAPLEQRFVWGVHQSDATQLIWNSEYLFSAEDFLARIIQAAGLPLTAYGASRVQIVYKRPFLAGQSCVLRGTVAVRKRDNAAVGLVGFHPVDGPNAVHDTPGVLVRLDGAFEPA